MDIQQSSRTRIVVLVLVSIVVGAVVGGGIVYNRVALRYRRQYETMWLLTIESDLFLAEKLRHGDTENVIKRHDTFLRGAALGIPGAIIYSHGTPHVLWAIKKYYHDNDLRVDPELKKVFDRVPDEEPEEGIGPLLP